MRKSAALCCLSSVVLFGMTATDCAYGQAQRFVQDRFAIGLWVDPPADEKMDQRYRELAEAHFTLVIGALEPKTNRPFERNRLSCASNMICGC
jgi:hypothetical protein